MKNKLLFILLIFIGGILQSCEKDDITFENKFEKSYKAWKSFKKSTDNTYKNTVSGSSWTGTSWETTLTIVDGSVIHRDFKYIHLEKGMDEIIPKEEQEWEEHADKINTHEHSPAAKALTLDEVYERAKNEWLVKRKDAKTFFEAENNGLLSSCGYVQEGCMDDCFIGIRIVNIEALPPNN